MYVNIHTGAGTGPGFLVFLVSFLPQARRLTHASRIYLRNLQSAHIKRQLQLKDCSQNETEIGLYRNTYENSGFCCSSAPELLQREL